jgi:hypothetical protein
MKPTPMLRGRRNDAETLPCCLCGAAISKDARDLTFLRVFPGRTHATYQQFWSHRKYIDEALHPSFAPDLDRDEAYGEDREDRGSALQREPLPCCLCGAGIEEPGDHIGLEARPGHMDDYVIFWTHRGCMRKAMHSNSYLQLRTSGIYGN